MPHDRAVEVENPLRHMFAPTFRRIFADLFAEDTKIRTPHQTERRFDSMEHFPFICTNRVFLCIMKRSISLDASGMEGIIAVFAGFSIDGIDDSYKI